MRTSQAARLWRIGGLAACLAGALALLALSAASGAGMRSMPSLPRHGAVVATPPPTASPTQPATHEPLRGEGPAGAVTISCLVVTPMGRAPGIYRGRLCLSTVPGAVLEVDSAECAASGPDGEVWSGVRVQVPPSGTLVLNDWTFASGCAAPFSELISVWGVAPDGTPLAAATRLCVSPSARGVRQDGSCGC